MKKETLERANELENQIEHYELLSYIMSYPYQRYRLFKKKPRVNHARSTSVDIVISDKELTKLIEDYCRNKIKILRQELEEM
jgi:hypothetical protein